MIKFTYNPRTQLGQITTDKFDVLREHFSIANSGALHQKKWNKYIPLRKYAITPSGKFKIGLYSEIRKFIADNQWVSTIEVDNNLNDAVFPKISDDYEENLSYSNRDFQKESVISALKIGRGIIQVGTGGGKTLIMASLIENIIRINPKAKILVIVPDTGLVSQTAAAFDEYKVPYSVSKWTGSDELDISSSVIIANSQIILSRIQDNSWIEYVDCLLVDEVHGLKEGNKISKVVFSIKTNNKFGFTGTVPNDNISRWNVIGLIGPVIYKKTGAQLRDEKYISPVEARVIEIEYKNKPEKVDSDHPTAQYHAELEFLYNNSYRNSVIQSISTNFNDNILILVNHIPHGEGLYELLSNKLKDKQVFFIRGDVAVEDREKIQNIMEKSNNVVCIAISKIFAVGISINNIHMIVFGAGGKSFIRTIQSIGRGVRLHDRKSKLFVVDIADQLKYGREHSSKRKEIYYQEEIPFSVKRLVEK